MTERAAQNPEEPTFNAYLNRYRPETTEVHYAEEVRFQKPTPPKFGLLPAALSVLSLLAMTIVAAVLLSQLRDPGTAVNWLPSFLAPPKTASGVCARRHWRSSSTVISVPGSAKSIPPLPMPSMANAFSLSMH